MSRKKDKKYKQTKKQRENHRQAALKQFKDGMPEKTKKKIKEKRKLQHPPMLDKKHSRKTLRKMSRSQKGNTNGFQKGNKLFAGEKNGRWLGGKSFEPYTVDWTETLRRAIRERDHYICQNCSQYGDIVHHIDYNKKNCNPNNLITLCRKCHSKTNGNRKYWIKHFQEKIYNIYL